MKSIRKQHTADYKFKVALDALSGTQTISELALKYGIHPIQITQWKRKLKEEGAELFGSEGKRKVREVDGQQAALYEEIGRLQFELNWLKKNLPCSIKEKRAMINLNDDQMGVRRQCELLGINRSSLYYEAAQESEENLQIMRLIDESYLETPYYGSRRMVAVLKQQGYSVNRKRVCRLMPLMGLEAIYPRLKTSQADQGHKAYPYLLRGLKIKCVSGLPVHKLNPPALAGGCLGIVPK